jgi:hypothetical protein
VTFSTQLQRLDAMRHQKSHIVIHLTDGAFDQAGSANFCFRDAPGDHLSLLRVASRSNIVRR